MREASSRGWSNIIFESDSKVVVDAIKAISPDRSELCPIICEIKTSVMCASFIFPPVIFFCFIPGDKMN
jgi:hypothetical protein